MTPVSQRSPAALACAVMTALAIVLAAGVHPRADRAGFDALWARAGHITDLDGRPVSLDTLAERAPASVWIVRVQAEWCGTCQWHAGWTPELLAQATGHVRVIDLVIADRDNAPADRAAGLRWRARTGGQALTLLADPTALAEAFSQPAPLPRVLIVDARTRTVAAALANPDPDALADALSRVVPRGAAPATRQRRIDSLFTPDQWALIQGMRLPAAPPPDPTNRVADDPRAAELGFQLFFDKGLSPVDIGCSNCHNPDFLFAERQNRPSYGVGRRNVPALVLVDRARALLWDGRADSPWGQAVIPIEDPSEMGSSRLFVAHRIYARYRPTYEAIFGPMPDLADEARYPPEGRPGTPEWAAMRPRDREAVSEVLANVGKAFAAFERQLRVPDTKLDRYAAGDLDALTPAEKDGLAAFFAAGCAQCHFGPRLSNDAFHNLRFPTARPDGLPDLGRFEALPLADDEFSRHGPFSDAPLPAPPAPRGDRALGAFRTPGLRGVAHTMPYGHGGGFDDLRVAIEAHRTGGLPADDPRTTGEAEPWAQGFDPALTARIVRFLRSLDTSLGPY